MEIKDIMRFNKDMTTFNMVYKFILLVTFFTISQVSLASTNCKNFETGKFYKQPGNIEHHFVINIDPDFLIEAPVSRFNVMDQAGKSAPEIQESLNVVISRTKIFYTDIKPLPQGRGSSQPSYRKSIVYAVTVEVKSSAYDLDWAFGGDHRYPTKSMTRNIFCTVSQTIAQTHN